MQFFPAVRAAVPGDYKFLHVSVCVGIVNKKTLKRTHLFLCRKASDCFPQAGDTTSLPFCLFGRILGASVPDEQSFQAHQAMLFPKSTQLPVSNSIKAPIFIGIQPSKQRLLLRRLYIPPLGKQKIDVPFQLFTCHEV